MGFILLAAVVITSLIGILIIHFSKRNARSVQGSIELSTGCIDDPVVVLQGCSKTFDTPEGKIRILNDIDLTVSKGTITAIQGESGCGKSTLLNIIGGLDIPDPGSRVIVAGRSIDYSSGAALVCHRKQVGLIYQGHNLVPHLSALDNVVLALAAKGWSWRKARQQAENWLRRVGLQDRLGYLPHQLSGGQQQRVGVARALIGSPKILLADEPTGNLDTGSAKRAMKLLRNCAEKLDIPVLIATHDKNLAKTYCDRILQWCEKNGTFRDVRMSLPNSVNQRREAAILKSRAV